MLTKRIIPCLDVDRGRVVKGVSFVNLRDAGDPAEMAAFYDAEGADELVFLDITAKLRLPDHNDRRGEQGIGAGIHTSYGGRRHKVDGRTCAASWTQAPIRRR